MSELSCLIVGRGRAGGSFETALRAVGHAVTTIAARPLRAEVAATPEADLRRLVGAADLVLLTVADDAIAPMSSMLARRVGPVGAVVAHVSGACGLDVLDGHERVGSLHPLMSLPDPTVGARRLLDHCHFAVAGDPLLRALADSLGGRSFEIPDDRRALYHATASVAANHLTALCDQVERLAADTGAPPEAFWTLMATSLENVAEHGAAASLTGPAARGDVDTLRRHLAACPAEERPLYLALCRRAARLAGRTLPDDLAGTGPAVGSAG